MSVACTQTRQHRLFTFRDFQTIRGMRVELKEIDMKQLNKMYIGEEGKATSVVLPPPILSNTGSNRFLYGGQHRSGRIFDL